jgi:hypothetical protein
MLPVVSVLGLEVHYAQIFAMLFLSLAGLHIYSNQVLSRREISFSEIEFTGDGVVRIGKVEVPALPYSLAVFAAVSFPGLLYLAGMLPGIELSVPEYFSLFVVAGVVASASLYCYGTARPKVRLRDKAKDLEDNVVDGLYHMASWASGSMAAGPAQELFAMALQRVRERRMTLEEAFGQVVEDVHSKRVKSLLAALTASLKRGTKVASNSLFSLLDHMNDLRETEEGLRTELSQVFGMMRLTVLVFAPLVCGLVVALTSLVQSSFSGFDALFLRTVQVPMGVLYLVLGLYVIALAYVLTRHISLINNSDTVGLRMDVAKALPMAFAVFVATIVFSTTLL